MAKIPATSYVLRLNTLLNNRKELHRRGYNSYVSGGGVITPPVVDPLVTTLTVSDTTPTPGSTVTLTASATGGVPGYTATWFVPAGSGITLSGSGLTRTFVAPTTTTSFTLRVSITDSAGNIDEDSKVIAVQGSVSSAANFAGHIPNRVIQGMAASGGTPPPGNTEARTIIGQPIYESRQFVGNWVTQASFNSMVAVADAFGGLPWISWKTPTVGSITGGWAAVRDKQYDADLVSLFGWVKTYGKPVIVSFWHEPVGDGTLGTWAQMQEYCAWFFAGYRNVTFNASTGTFTKGTYVAANDLTLKAGGNMTWSPCTNGYSWRTNPPDANGPAQLPQQLLDAVKACNGMIGADLYDCAYANADLAYTDEAARVPKTGVPRTSTYFTNFFNWCRARGVVAIGIGEWGCLDGPEVTRAWTAMRNNRDIVSVANYFNSLQNSVAEWRLIPADYPDTNYASSKLNSAGVGFQDLGGSPSTEAKLIAFRQVLTESVSAQYTSPL